MLEEAKQLKDKDDARWAKKPAWGSWGPFGSLLEALWGSWEASGRLLGASWGFWGASWRLMGSVSEILKALMELF